MVICFGGDGTILHIARTASENNVPILGINLGSMGFMAELELGELEQIAKIAEDKYTLEQRMMLDVKILRDGKFVYSDVALNDAVVAKGAVARVIDLSVFADDILISKFSGDGVIISTPTGSTAYSMSARRPHCGTDCRKPDRYADMRAYAAGEILCPRSQQEGCHPAGSVTEKICLSFRRRWESREAV